MGEKTQPESKGSVAKSADINNKDKRRKNAARFERFAIRFAAKAEREKRRRKGKRTACLGVGMSSVFFVKLGKTGIFGATVKIGTSVFYFIERASTSQEEFGRLRAIFPIFIVATKIRRESGSAIFRRRAEAKR